MAGAAASSRGPAGAHDRPPQPEELAERAARKQQAAAARDRGKRQAEALLDAAAAETITFGERATPALKLPRTAAAADGDAEAASTVFAKKRPGQANMRQRKKPEH